MRTLEETVSSTIIEEDEAKIIRTCLDYCYHRLVRHDKCGISGIVNVDKLNNIRKEL